MNADIKGCLNNIDRAYRVFEHNGKPMTKLEVQVVLSWALLNNITQTKDLKDRDIDNVLFKLNELNR